jgi:hypothetical protein
MLSGDVGRFGLALVIGLVAASLGWWAAASGAKTQGIRLLDVFVYGPLLVTLAVWPSLVTEDWARAGLIVMGATTITYNARNWFLAAGVKS